MFLGTVFPGSYNSSQGFLQLMFYKFAHFARYTDFLLLYKDFNGVGKSKQSSETIFGNSEILYIASQKQIALDVD